MEITIGSWFTEPGVYFKFSYKVELFFREQVIDYIIVPNKLDKINEDKYLHLTICTKLNQDIQDILDVNRGPKWRKNTTNRNHAIWIPYKPVVESENPLKNYIDFFCDALVVIFKEWDIRKDKIETIRENCYQELLNNEIYLHQEDEDFIAEQEKLTEEIKKEFG